MANSPFRYKNRVSPGIYTEDYSKNNNGKDVNNDKYKFLRDREEDLYTIDEEFGEVITNELSEPIKQE